MKCSFCKETINDNYRYCPWCGKCMKDKIIKKRKKIAIERIVTVIFAMAILNVVTVFGFICLRSDGAFASNPLAVTRVTTAEDTQLHSDETETVTEEETVPKETATTSQNKENENEATEKSNISSAQTVYVTPHGKRYHLKASCAGKTATAVKLSEAKKSHTPCKKCAGG